MEGELTISQRLLLEEAADKFGGGLGDAIEAALKEIHRLNRHIDVLDRRVEVLEQTVGG